MPIGRQQPGTVDAPAGPRPATLDFAEKRPASELTIPEQLGVGRNDLFSHRTIQPAELASGEVAVCRPERPFFVWQVQVIESVELILGLDDDPRGNNYDAVHPGLAEVTRICPETQALHVVARSNPAENVEVYLYAGSFAARAV